MSKRTNPKAKQERAQEVRNQATVSAWEELCVRSQKNGRGPMEEALSCPDCGRASTSEQLKALLDAACDVIADEDGAACPMQASRALVAAGLVLWFAPGAQVVEDVLRHVDELIAAVAHHRLCHAEPQEECSAPGGEA